MKKFIGKIVLVLSLALILVSAQAISLEAKDPVVGILSDYYSDVDSNLLFFDSIEFISDKKIVKGYEDGTFKPGKLLNRAELLKILVEAKYDSSQFDSYYDQSCFKDVKAKEWYTKYVCFGKHADIVEGYGDGTFKPGQTVNLVEALKMALTTFGYSYKTSDPWYKNIVENAAMNNFIPLTFANFDQAVERGDMADLIARILKFEEGNLDEFLGTFKDTKVDYNSLKNHTYVLAGGWVDNTDTEYPSNVSALSVEIIDSGIKLKWGAAKDNVGVDGYKIFYGNNPVDKVGDVYSNVKDVGDVTTYEFYGLNSGQKYYFSVIAYDAAGNESVSWATEVSAVFPELEDKEEDIISRVCGTDNVDSRPGGDTYYCSDVKKKNYGCEYVVMATYGTRSFLQCYMYNVGADDVLVHTGGLLDGGWNLMREKDDASDEVVSIKSAVELLEYWGEIDSKESAKWFAVAVTGESILDPDQHFKDVFGESFELEVPANEVLYTVVKKSGNQYEIPLYFETVFGCNTFPVTQNVYIVSDNGIALKESKQIGHTSQPGLCAD